MAKAKRIRDWFRFSAGVLLALTLLSVVNLLLFHDGVIQRFASVFAVGRAMDKQRFAEQQCPAVLFMGNSRVDNAVDPKRIQRQWQNAPSVFNLGIPGANARIGYGLLTRLERVGCLTGERIKLIVIGLDESYLQDDDSLGYKPFFANRAALIEEGAHKDWFGTWLRLWSYTDNLRQLHEPEKAQRFFQAIFKPIEPVGGAAWRHLGYRAGFGEGSQNAGQVLRQEVGSGQPPSPAVFQYLYKTQTMLRQHGIQLVVVFPPLLTRGTAYVDPAQAEGSYVVLLEQLRAQGLQVIESPDPVPRAPEYFVNAGHLNDRGAQIYSEWLASMLAAAWPWLDGGVRR